jgi:D-sedoheptulose 7-phosphate isomerase
LAESAYLYASKYPSLIWNTVSFQAFHEQYLSAFHTALDAIEVQEGTESVAYAAALDTITQWLVAAQQTHKKVMIIGNGGSAGIASHMATDFLKNAGMRAMAFNDPSQLTCLANDIGYEDVFAMPIARFADPGDVVMCISTSGRSENILRSAKVAREAGCHVITCSGFHAENALRPLGHINFYVPSHSYGVVETLHQYIIHSILDAKLYCADAVDIFYHNQPLEKNAQ